MVWIGLALVLIVLCFSFVLLFGAPYLPTLSANMRTALDLLGLREGQTMLELGCGDGKVLIAAAQRGWHAVGYELNPLLVLVCLWRTRRYRGQIRVRWGNFWHASLPPADGIFVFALQRYMDRLHTKIVQEARKPVKLVSFVFTIPDKRPDAEKNGVYLYEYR